MSIESVIPSNCHLLCCRFLLPPSVLPSTRVIFSESALCISGQSVGASVSASVPHSVQWVATKRGFRLSCLEIPPSVRCLHATWIPILRVLWFPLGRRRYLRTWAWLSLFESFPRWLWCSYPSKWRRKWQPTPVFLPGEFHGQRSLVGHSPWGCRVWHYWETNTHMTQKGLWY